MFNIFKTKNKKRHSHKIKSALIRFVIFGLLGYAVEIIVSSSMHLANDIRMGLFSAQSLEMMGYTGFWTFFVYGAASLPYSFLYTKLRKSIPNKLADVPLLGFFVRISFYTVIFFAIEFVTSGFAKYILGIQIHYDYSGKPYSVLGLIDLSMFPFWMLLAWFGEIVTVRLMQFEQILSGPSIHREIHVFDAIKNYFSNIKFK